MPRLLLRLPPAETRGLWTRAEHSHGNRNSNRKKGVSRALQPHRTRRAAMQLRTARCQSMSVGRFLSMSVAVSCLSLSLYVCRYGLSLCLSLSLCRCLSVGPVSSSHSASDVHRVSRSSAHTPYERPRGFSPPSGALPLLASLRAPQSKTHCTKLRCTALHESLGQRRGREQHGQGRAGQGRAGPPNHHSSHTFGHH